jgi:hypothetical protein
VGTISVAGNKIRKSSGTQNRAPAQEFEQHERERAWRELKLGDRTAVPWREAAARWLTETKKRTKSKDEYMLAWFGGYLDNEPPSAIDRDTIEDLREGLREEGASESTVDRYMALLRAILRKARDEWRYIDNIPKVPMYGRHGPALRAFNAGPPIQSRRVSSTKRAHGAPEKGG